MEVGLESRRISRHEMPSDELPRDVAYEIIHDELMLDGNARLNVATFVASWMEPEADRLMAECFDKNMIDKDEYPQTAEIETRCVNMLSRLWHAVLLLVELGAVERLLELPDVSGHLGGAVQMRVDGRSPIEGG